MKKLTALLAAGMLSLLCACIRTDYESIAEFPPLPNDIKVVIYYDKSQFPVEEKEQVEVGKATASAYTSSYTLSDIKQKLMRMAKEHGANAILVVSLDHQLDGQVRTDQVKNMSAPTWTPVDDSATDAREQRYMDLYSSAKDGELPVYKITIKAVFYKVPEQAQLKEPVMVGDVPPRKTPAPAPAAEQKKDESGKKADQN